MPISWSGLVTLIAQGTCCAHLLARMGRKGPDDYNFLFYSSPAVVRMSCSSEVRLSRFSRVLRKRWDSAPVSMMCARSVMRSSSALNSRAFESPESTPRTAGCWSRLLPPSLPVPRPPGTGTPRRLPPAAHNRLRPYRNRLGGRGQSRALQAEQHRPESISHFVRGQRDAATVSGEYIFEMELQQAPSERF